MKRPGIVPVVTATLLVTAIGIAAVASEISTPLSQAAPFDLLATENGGRVEWSTGEPLEDGMPSFAIAATRRYGWLGLDTFPQDIVFSFFSRQSALIASVEINPKTDAFGSPSRDVEIWTSTLGPKDGFTKVATATLKDENSLQPIAFTPVDAKFVKLRVLSTQAGPDKRQRAQLRRIRILEGQREGYVSILARNPELAALVKGGFPAAPADPGGSSPRPGGAATCSAPVTRGKSRFPQSKNVLLVRGTQDVQRPFVRDHSDLKAANLEQPAIPGLTLRLEMPEVLSPAMLISEPRIDTVVLGQVCDMSRITKDFKQALMAWVAAGHKLIIQDSDACKQGPDYGFLPYPLKTLNPGAAGARGLAGVLEDSTLISSNKRDASFLDFKKWSEGPNDLGDSNILIEWDSRWCGAAWSRNRFQKSGFALAYAHFGRGLLIYDGFDYDQAATLYYRQLIAQQILHPFDPDYLPCSNPIGSFTLAADNVLKNQPMAAGRTYTYPVEILGNFGYSGRVTLDASITPADPAMTATLSATVADLTKVDEAQSTLTVVAGAAASLKNKVITVRGRDAAGKSSVLCLNLPERRTGGITVSSALRRDKPPTKNLEIILDASGSMKALLGKQTRWATAQAVLKDVVSKLPKDFSVGLRAYGHTLPSTNPGTCKDTSLVVPIGPLNPAAFLAAAAKLAPRGETPLVHSILQTPADLKAAGGGTVILITDGEESCKGDFATAAKTLQDAGLNVTVNIVGFTLKPSAATAALAGLAESTGGHYYPANSGESLARAILLAAVDRLPYRILDAAGKEVARGEAGVDQAHELPPGAYTVVVTAGEQDAKFPATLAVGQDLALRARIQGDKLIVER